MKLSVVIPAHNEQGTVAATLQDLYRTLSAEGIPHELLVINDNSTDETGLVLADLEKTIPTLRHLDRIGDPGYGKAVRAGLSNFSGDAVAVCMADGSDSPKDLVRYYRTLVSDQVDCVFGSRFAPGATVVDYPKVKLLLNRLANKFIQILFGLRYNDVTNAFKLFRKEVIQGVQPLLSHHFNLTVEIPLKAIVRGYTFSIVPNDWRQRKAGESKLKIKEMGSRYLFIILYCFIEKWLSRGDYHRGRPVAVPPKKVALLEGLREYFGFEHQTETLLWSALMTLVMPLTFVARFWFWTNPILEPHPIRQTQTALTIQQMFQGTATLFDYRSPLNGTIWNFVYEFPLYQWLSAQVMKLGAPLEVAARSVTMFFFLASTVLLVWAASRHLGRRIAAWTGALWLLSPLGIFYSRACLIDFCSFFFALATLTVFLDVYLGRTRLGWKALALGTALGCVAGLSKATIWCTPTALQGLLILGQIARQKKIRREQWLLGGSLVVQLIAVLAWLRWANYLRSESGVLTTEDWIFGSLHQRFQLKYWRTILSNMTFGIYQGWMAVAVLHLMTRLKKAWRPWVAGLAFLSLVPTLITFNVHYFHDYYLIGEAAFFIVLAAFGMTTLFSDRRAWTGAAWCLIAALFAWKVRNAPGDYQPIVYDFSKRLGPAKQIRSLTSVDDLVYIDGPNQEYEIPLYAERLVATPWCDKGLEQNKISPTVFKLNSEHPRTELLRPFSSIWVQGGKDYFVYRVAQKGEFKFDPSRFLGVSGEAKQAPDYRIEGEDFLSVKAEPKEAGFVVVEVAGQASTIQVKASRAGSTYVFPKRNFLFLPAPSAAEPETYQISLLH